MKQEKQLFWGLILISLAGMILFKNHLPDLGLPIWKLLLVAYMSVESLTHLLRKNLHTAYIGAAIAFITLNSEYHWLKVGIWSMAVAALLIYFGIRLIFPKKAKWQSYVSVDGEPVRFVGKAIGSSTRYINDDNFIHGNANVVFGSTNIYFDNAVILGDKASFDLDVVFSSATLYVPKNWRVEVIGDNVFSSVENPFGHEAKDKLLEVQADLVFSSLIIRYV